MRAYALALARGEEPVKPRAVVRLMAPLADAANGAAHRAGEAIDEALAFVDESNRRIDSMQSKAAQRADLEKGAIVTVPAERTRALQWAGELMRVLRTRV